MMFEHELLERARADKRRVVLPEGTEERVLRAAEVLLRRGVCDLTLLGDEDAIRKKAADLGIDLGGRPARRPADLAAAGHASPSGTRSCARTRASPSSWPTTSSPTSPTSAR